jgi:hypothetical protein
VCCGWSAGSRTGARAPAQPHTHTHFRTRQPHVFNICACRIHWGSGTLLPSPRQADNFFFSLWLPVLIVTNRPRETPETPRTIPSGQFGAGTSPRAGSNHPRRVRTEFDRRLARRRPPGGPAATVHVRGGVVQRESPESGGGAGRPVGRRPTPIPALHSCPGSRHRVAVKVDRTTQPTFKARLPVGDFQFAC